MTTTPYHWITAEDVVRHALAAYHALCCKADAIAAYYPAEDFPTHRAHSFAEDLGEVFAVSLLKQGFDTTGDPSFPPGMEEYLNGLLDTSDYQPAEVSVVTAETLQHIHRRAFGWPA